MYCLLEIQSSSLKKPRRIEKEQYNRLLHIKTQSADLVNAVELFSFFTESYEELRNWCMHTDMNAEYLMSNKHTAERKCRGVLFEFKTFLDHTESLLKKTFGKNSDAATAFTQGTNAAYDQNPEYAFVYQLRNSMQHFDSIVHSFAAPVAHPYIQPCSDPKILLRDSGWKEQERNFVLAANGNIELYEVFVTTYNAMGSIMVPVMDYLLKWNDSAADIIMLRNWTEPLFTREESKYFHLAEEDEAGNTVAFPVNWEVIYKIADSLNQQ